MDVNTRIEGVVVGRLAGVDGAGRPTVRMPWSATPRRARTTVALDAAQVGSDVVVALEEGDPAKLIVIGVLQNPGAATAVRARVDGEEVVLEGRKEVVLRCGKASVTLTRAGKILIRGAYVSSRSSGVNRIKGGSVQIN